MRRGGRGGGFTLAELLIAVSIAAVVGMTAYGVLRAVVRGAAVVEQTARARTTARAVLGLLRRDVASAAALRAPARPGRRATPADAGETRPRDSLSLVVLDGPGGVPAEVAYDFEGETFIRWARPRDEIRDAEGVPIAGVEALDLRFGRGGRWNDWWDDTAAGLPQAVAVRLWVEGGEYVLVVPVEAGGV